MSAGGVAAPESVVVVVVVVVPEPASVAVDVEVAAPSVVVVVPPSGVVPPQAVNEAAKAKLAAARAIVWNFTITFFRLLSEIFLLLIGCFQFHLPPRQVSKSIPT